DLLILKATFSADGVGQMYRDATRAGEIHPPDSPWRGMSCWYAGAALHLAGDLQGARERLEEGARRGAATGALAQVFNLSQLTLVHLDRGDLESAGRVAAQAREQCERFELYSYPVMAIALVASAVVRSREGRIEQAVSDQRRALSLLDSLAQFPE